MLVDFETFITDTSDNLLSTSSYGLQRFLLLYRFTVNILTA